jgi:hypothetical protein
MESQYHYLPLTPGFFSILVFLAIALVILIQLRILRYAYMRLGVGPGVALLLLFGSLIGSYFNIPITVLSGPPVRAGEVVDFFGMRYVVPYVVSPSTILAVNVGGAVIPTVMSTYAISSGSRPRSPSLSSPSSFIPWLHRFRESASPCRFLCRWWQRPSSPCSSPANMRRRSPISAARWEH